MVTRITHPGVTAFIAFSVSFSQHPSGASSGRSKSASAASFDGG